MVADEEVAFHGTRGDDVGLDQGGRREQVDEERAHPLRYGATLGGFAACGPEGGGSLPDRGAEPVGADVAGETKYGQPAGTSLEVAAAVPKKLFHGTAILPAKLGRIGVEKDRVEAAETAHQVGFGSHAFSPASLAMATVTAPARRFASARTMRFPRAVIR